MSDFAGWLSRLDGPLRESFGEDAPPELSRKWEAARAAWPAVELAPERFCGFLAERLARAGSLGSMNAPDLYLACACLDGNLAAPHR